MAVRAPALSVDDQDYYPLHEEDDLPEIPPHEATVRDLRNVLSLRFPGWFITGNVCIYWERGNTKKYRAPDLFMVREPLTEEVHRVYQTWKQPPVTFVAEIGSKSTFRKDEGPKVGIYQDLIRAGEYLYADPPKGILRLWRQGPAGYVEVAPEANRRLRSEALALEFGLDETGELRLYTLEGERLLTHEETEAARQAAEAARQAAEAARAGAEARAADLERQLAALRAQLEEREAGGSAE
jgi:Uma2 family endonuclease